MLIYVKNEESCLKKLSFFKKRKERKILLKLVLLPLTKNQLEKEKQMDFTNNPSSNLGRPGKACSFTNFYYN